MSEPIKVGDTFELKRGKRVDVYRRDADDPSPVVAGERIRVTHISCSAAVPFEPYTFGAEPEWFTRRGLVAA